MDYYEKTKKEIEIFSGRIIKVKELEVSLPSGVLTKREIVEHPGAVAILAITDEKKLVLLRQFRKAVEEILWEIPAGKLEKGEDPLVCAKRELQEETGYTADVWKKAGEFYTTPGFTNEMMHLYWAESLKSGPTSFDLDEYVEIHTLSLEELDNLNLQGQIKDAKTIIGLLHFKLREK